MRRVRQSLERVRAIRKRRLIRNVLIIFIIFIAIFSYFTNPFVEYSIIADPFRYEINNENQLELTKNTELKLRTNVAVRFLADAKAGWHILINRFVGGKKTKSTQVDEIIREIHELRFDPQQPFLISGDHFSVLYPRSLGIFYHSLLDPRTALDSTDWKNRQEIYLKTTTYALEIFADTKKLATTIVPIGPQSVTLINIYALPSDTLYSLLYALHSMQTSDELATRYTFTSDNQPPLQTRTAAQALTNQYASMLKEHLDSFTQTVTDQSTGLVRKDILLSGTKDITKRQSAFYDNVMLWKTHQLAQQLGITPEDTVYLSELKEKIVQTFWLESEGYFLEDLSAESIQHKYYSSDWLIAYMTGFLDVQNVSEQAYFTRSIEYIQKNNIDQPFALRYHNDLRRHRQHFWVKLFIPAYGASAIWSNWGMEYVKLLTALTQLTCNQNYLQTAEKNIQAYTENIEAYRGYPELYDTKGNIFAPLFYKSVVRTGWIVSFEQARAMLAWTKANSCNPQTPEQTMETEEGYL